MDPAAQGYGGGTSPHLPIPLNVSEWQAPRGSLSVRTAFGEAWALTRSNLGIAFLIGFVATAVLSLTNGSGFGVFLLGPLMAGMFYAMLRLVLAGRAEVGDLFKGFSVFVPLMLIGLLSSTFMGIGLTLCVIPGVIVFFMYQMAYLFVLDRRMDFWPAMEASRKIYFANFWGLTLLYFLEGLLMTAGSLLCCVGAFIAYPLTEAMTISAYRQLVGFERQGDFEPEAPLPR